MHERFVNLMPGDGIIEDASAGIVGEGRDGPTKVGGGVGHLLESGGIVVIPDEVSGSTRERLEMWRSGQGGDLRRANYHGQASGVDASRVAMDRLRSMQDTAN